MKTSIVLSVVIAGLCGMATVLGVVAGRATAQESGPAPTSANKPLKVGVVRIDEQIYVRSPLATELMNEANAAIENDFSETMKKLEDERVSKREKLRAEESSPTATPEFLDDLRREIELLEEKLKTIDKQRNSYRATLQARAAIDFNTAVMIVIRMVAAKHGFDLVFRSYNKLDESEEERSASARNATEIALGRSFDTISLLYFNGRTKDNPKNYTIEDLTELVQGELKNKSLQEMRPQIDKELGRYTPDAPKDPNNPGGGAKGE